MKTRIILISKVIDGVEIVYEEIKGFKERTYTYSFVISKEDFEKIKEEYEK